MKINIDIDPEVIPQIIKTLEEKRERLLSEAAQINQQIDSLKGVNGIKKEVEPVLKIEETPPTEPTKEKSKVVFEEIKDSLLIEGQKFPMDDITRNLITIVRELFIKKDIWYVIDMEKKILSFIIKKDKNPDSIRKLSIRIRGALNNMEISEEVDKGKNLNKKSNGQVYYKKR